MLSYQIQVSDLANYMRKMLEKNNWNTGLGMDLICAYDRVRRLTAVELNYLYLYMAYPENSGKLRTANYNTHKAWCPDAILKSWKNSYGKRMSGNDSWNDAPFHLAAARVLR